MYGSTKIEFLIFQNNLVFIASAFLSVQFKSNTECSVNSVFYHIPYIPYIPYFRIFHSVRHSVIPPFLQIGSPFMEHVEFAKFQSRMFNLLNERAPCRRSPEGTKQGNKIEVLS